MPIIGNPIYQSAFVVDQFSGNGSTTAFTMSVAPAGVTNVLVAVSGVLQDPSTYGVVGNTITFSAAPPSGTGNISCRYLGVPVTGVTTTAYRTVTEFTATASQTTFTPPSYSVGFINVYLNGVLLGSADYTASNGTTVVLATGASAGNLVTVESFQVSSVLNAIPNTAGAINLAGSLVTGTLPVANGGTGVTTSTGSGAVVLATSPTLVTPALGTPSAVNLSNATGLPASALPAGSIRQVLQTIKTNTYSASGNGGVMPYAVTGLSISITPSSASNKILVFAEVFMGLSDFYNYNFYWCIARNTTPIGIGTSGGQDVGGGHNMYLSGGSVPFAGGSAKIVLDSPATTSSVTYQIYIGAADASATLYINQRGSGASPTGVSSVTAMEVVA